MAQTKSTIFKEGVRSSRNALEDDRSSKSEDSLSSSDGELEGNGAEDVEEDYHTEGSDDSDAENDEDSEGLDDLIDDENLPFTVAHAPLLPMELLKPLPSPAHSLWDSIHIPWNQMTREQKRAERSRSRKAAKNEWAKLNRDARGMQQAAKRTGVLAAGKAAQLRRMTVRSQDKTKVGRVKKTAKAQLSGREKLLHRRKISVEQSGRTLKPPMKKKKKALPKR